MWRCAVVSVFLAAGCGTGGSDDTADTPATSAAAEASCPEVESPPPTSGPAPAPEESGPLFRPATYREGDRTVMPVTFLDGTSAELVYEPELALEDTLVVPGWAGGTTPGEVSRDFLIRYGTLTDLASFLTELVSTELVRSDAIVCVYRVTGLSDYLMFQFEDWVVGIHSADAMSPDVRATWARDLSLRVAPDGFPVLGSSGGTHFWEHGPGLGFQQGGPGIQVILDGCALDEDTYESGELAGYGRRCIAGTGVEISVNNFAGATVDEVLEGLTIREIRHGPPN